MSGSNKSKSAQDHENPFAEYLRQITQPAAARVVSESTKEGPEINIGAARDKKQHSSGPLSQPTNTRKTCSVSKHVSVLGTSKTDVPHKTSEPDFLDPVVQYLRQITQPVATQEDRQVVNKQPLKKDYFCPRSKASEPIDVDDEESFALPVCKAPLKRNDSRPQSKASEPIDVDDEESFALPAYKAPRTQVPPPPAPNASDLFQVSVPRLAKTHQFTVNEPRLRNGSAFRGTYHTFYNDGSGDCLFKAVIQALGMEGEINSAIMRRRMVDFIKDHLTDFRLNFATEFIGRERNRDGVAISMEKWDEYAEAMLMRSTYAGNGELGALSLMYNFNAVVWILDPKTNTVKFAVDHRVPEPFKTIHLVNHTDRDVKKTVKHLKKTGEMRKRYEHFEWCNMPSDVSPLMS